MAMRAARSPSQGRGRRNPKRAREGMVWRMLARPMTGRAQAGARVRAMPVGTAMAVAASMAAPVSQRCSRVRVAISEPNWERKDVMGVDPFGEAYRRGLEGFR